MIIEQSNKNQFNKGKLLNTGFIEITKKFNNINNIHFSDVDNYPLNTNVINYRNTIENVNHYFGHTHCIGGIYAFNKKIFKDINGFSNNFWAWGYEDADLQNRVKLKKYKINRDNFIGRGNNNKIYDKIDRKNKFYKDNQIQEKIFFKKYIEDIKNIYKDGLNNIKYKKISDTEIEKNIFRIKVDL